MGALAAERALPSGVTGPRDLLPLAREAAMRRRRDDREDDIPAASVADAGEGFWARVGYVVGAMGNILVSSL